MKHYLLVIILIFVILCFASCNIFISSKECVVINKNNSFFDTYYIEGDKVYLRCFIEVENKTNDFQSFKIIAKFPDDTGVLLNELSLYAKNTDSTDTVFSLTRFEKKTIHVEFIGTFAGTKIKHDKNLPNLTIVFND